MGFLKRLPEKDLRDKTKPDPIYLLGVRPIFIIKKRILIYFFFAFALVAFLAGFFFAAMIHPLSVKNVFNV